MFNYYPVTSCLDNILSFTCGIHDSVFFLSSKVVVSADDVISC